MDQIESLTRLVDQQSLVLGSGAGSDLLFRDPGVEGRHARVFRRGDELMIQDLDTMTGTFVNGREVRGLVSLRPGDRLQLGSLQLVIPGPAAAPGDRSTGPAAVQAGGSAVAVGFDGVVKRFRDKSRSGGTILGLDAVSFRIDPGRFVGILGASGSGKSTLIKALAGVLDFTSGTILLDDRPMSPPDLRGDRRIAYLPQDVIIHETLSSRVALDVIARLKGIGETAVDRRDLIAHSLGRVGLSEHGGKPIHALSGGQRKRAALAAELLGDPKLILLDEATSGLDPATEAEMMGLFRSLADEGRTVICITHFTGQVHLCDRLLYMMGGKCIFDGHVDALKEFFDVEDVEAAYTRQSSRSPGDWEAAFRNSPSGRGVAAPSARGPVVALPSSPPAPMSPSEWGRQATVLTSRLARLQWADIRNLMLLFAQTPAIALMLAMTFGSIKNTSASQEAADTKQVLFVLVLAVLWCSSTMSIREVVKELPILRHEMRFGVRLVPYILSKFVLLGLFSSVQALVLLWMVKSFTELSGPFGPQYAILGCTSLVGIALGLLVSASSGNSERAMTLLPVLLIAQAIFSGGLARLSGAVELFSMMLVPAYWAMEGLKSPLGPLRDERFVGEAGHPEDFILGKGQDVMIAEFVLFMHLAMLLALTYWVLRLQVGAAGRRPGPAA